MCVIFIATHCHPKYKLVIAANRDEYLSRPALPANYWQDNPQILAGIDLKEGGTWMGITKSGRFAALTNYRDPANFNPQAPSRGKIVSSFLNSDINAYDYLSALLDEDRNYNGYNLLVGSFDAIYYFSNREKEIQKLRPGCHGLSNSFLNDPWFKVAKGMKCMESCLKEDCINVPQLLTMMADTEKCPKSKLPQTGVNQKLELDLSSIFVSIPAYGTRTTTIILVDNYNNVEFFERNYDQADPASWHDSRFFFKSS